MLFTEGTQILGVAAQNVVATATWRLGFVYPCITQFITRHSVVTPTWKFLRVGSGNIKGTEVCSFYYLRGFIIRTVHGLNYRIIHHEIVYYAPKRLRNVADAGSVLSS